MIYETDFKRDRKKKHIVKSYKWKEDVERHDRPNPKRAQHSRNSIVTTQDTALRYNLSKT